MPIQSWPLLPGGWPPGTWAVPYVASAGPGAVGPGQWLQGANCQVFAYGILELFGLSCPPLRSSNLWEESVATIAVERPEPLDLVLFNATGGPVRSPSRRVDGAGRCPPPLQGSRGAGRLADGRVLPALPLRDHRRLQTRPQGCRRPWMSPSYPERWSGSTRLVPHEPESVCYKTAIRSWLEPSIADALFRQRRRPRAE